MSGNRRAVSAHPTRAGGTTQADNSLVPLRRFDYGFVASSDSRGVTSSSVLATSDSAQPMISCLIEPEPSIVDK